MAGAHHRDVGYRRRAKRIRHAANADPDTTCWRCGHRLDTCGPNGDGTHADGQPATWHAGHTVDGDNDSPLAAECSPCNLSHGGKLGHRRSPGAARSTRDHHSERW